MPRIQKAIDAQAVAWYAIGKDSWLPRQRGSAFCLGTQTVSPLLRGGTTRAARAC